MSDYKVGYFVVRLGIFSPKGCENAFFKVVAELRSESIMCLHYGQTLDSESVELKGTECRFTGVNILFCFFSFIVFIEFKFSF